MEFLLFYEVLKILIFFSITYQKSWRYNTNNRQILKANLWSIYSKRSFITFICVFSKIKFF